MKNLILITLIGLMAQLTYASTNHSSADSLVKGKIYKVITNDMNEITGVLTYNDSDIIILRELKKLYRVNKDLIHSIAEMEEDINDFIPDTSVNSIEKVSEKIKFDPEANYDVNYQYLGKICYSTALLKNVSIKNIKKDSIVFAGKYKTKIRLKIENISKLTVKKGSLLAVPVLLLGGAVSGGFIGYLAAKPFEEGYGYGTALTLSIGIITGGITGAVVGFIISHDDEYDLSGISKQEKISKIREIVR